MQQVRLIFYFYSVILIFLCIHCTLMFIFSQINWLRKLRAAVNGNLQCLFLSERHTHTRIHTRTSMAVTHHALQYLENKLCFLSHSAHEVGLCVHSHSVLKYKESQSCRLNGASTVPFKNSYYPAKRFLFIVRLQSPGGVARGSTLITEDIKKPFKIVSTHLFISQMIHSKHASLFHFLLLWQLSASLKWKT